MFWPAQVIDAYMIRGETEPEILTDQEELAKIVSIASTMDCPSGTKRRLLEADNIAKGVSIKLLVKYDDETTDMIPLELFQPADAPSLPADQDPLVSAQRLCIQFTT